MVVALGWSPRGGLHNEDVGDGVAMRATLACDISLILGLMHVCVTWLCMQNGASAVGIFMKFFQMQFVIFRKCSELGHLWNSNRGVQHSQS